MTTETENQELQILQFIVAFLNRVELKGNEVPAFNAALEYLQQKAQPLLPKTEGGNSEMITGAPLPSTVKAIE
jgi:hypothetical protein